MTVTQKPHSGPPRLVLAFDIGTTFSGISYCIFLPGQIPEIRGITKFPGQDRGQGNAKVPSILYYDDDGNVKAVGSEALTMKIMNKAEDEGWTKAEWWKLHLRPKHLASAHIKDDDIPPLPSGKSAVDILSDFVKYLFKCTKSYIEEHYIMFNWSSIENSVEFIFTHPNGWEGRQQQLYREAIERASLIPSTPEGRSRVYMVTEGEASLHYCVSTLPENPPDTGPQGVVIIDAGGGTIDLSMYSLTFSPIACNEVAPAECRLQGSVFVTRRAADLLKEKLQGTRHCNADEMDIITHEFDQNTKLSINSADEPAYVKIGHPRYNNPRYGIKRGALTLSGEEITALFDDSINAIIDSFEQQRMSAETKITMAFVVGGLGTNELLWTRLRSHFQAQGIKISRPDNDINKAVANGAVLFHINRENHLTKTTWSTFAGRINGAEIYQANTRLTELFTRYFAEAIKLTSKGKFDIPFVLLIGTEAASVVARLISHAIAALYLTRNGLTRIHATSFSQLCTIKADLRQVAENPGAKRTNPSGKVYYTVDFEVVASFGKTELTAQIAWMVDGKEQRSPATIVYYDN